MDQILPGWLNSNITYALLGLTVYSAICQTLRYRRINRLQQEYSYGTQKKSFSEMTVQDAWTIQKVVSDVEFPSLFEKGLQLALFRTYGIPTIASTLMKTRQLSTSEHVGKRYSDTAVFVTEIYANFPSEERSHEAFARLNYIHGHYIKQGRISNDDMLYTLGLFMTEPVVWINTYEWRKLTPLEVCAIATSHLEIGRRMHISFDPLPSSKTGWEDGLHLFREMQQWCKQYEEQYMIPNKESYDVAIKTKEVFLSTVPPFSHNLVAHVITAAMDDRLRESIMFQPAHPTIKKGLDAFMAVRRFYLRFFALPKFSKLQFLSKEESPDGHRWVEIYGVHPHYVRPTFWRRWGPTGLFELAIGAPRAGDPGMCPEGYQRSNLGPKSFDGKGREDFRKEKALLAEMSGTGECPFARVKV